MKWDKYLKYYYKYLANNMKLDLIILEKLKKGKM